MKNFWMPLFTFALLLTFGASFNSCERDEDEMEVASISDEEILEIVSGATLSSSEGITAEALEMTAVADEITQEGQQLSSCGETVDSTFNRIIDLDRITGEYNNYLFWGFTCNELQLPVSIFFGREMSGNYETQRWLSNDAATSEWTINNLLAGSNYVFDGRYERNGTQESKVREMRAFTSTIVIEIEDLNISKSQPEITSGIASYTLSGTVNGETSFNHEGTIVFLGDGTANVIINGTTYTIDLNP
ncbi:MAG: hypothetical protein AAFR36_11900 [Bacteroidota bacterium]